MTNERFVFHFSPPGLWGLFGLRSVNISVWAFSLCSHAWRSPGRAGGSCLTRLAAPQELVAHKPLAHGAWWFSGGRGLVEVVALCVVASTETPTGFCEVVASTETPTVWRPRRRAFVRAHGRAPWARCV